MSDGAWLKRIDLETFESERVALASDEISIGRTKQGALTFSATAAKTHCVLRQVGGAWVVEDRNSASGTWVNGHRVTGATLHHGDVIDLYGVLLVFLDQPEHTSDFLEAAIDAAPHEPERVQVWADWLIERGDPLGQQLTSGEISPDCLEGLEEQVETGRLELSFSHGLIERAVIRCTSDSTFQDVDLLGRLLSLRACRWVRSLTVDLCTWTMPTATRLQSDAAAALRGLLSGPELPALEALSFGYVPTPLPPSHFREALLERLPARFPRLRTRPKDVLPVVRHAWLELVRVPDDVDWQYFGPGERKLIPLHTGVWVGGSSPKSMRAVLPGVRRPGLSESFLVRQEVPQFCLMPGASGVLLNGRPAVATRLLPGDEIVDPRGLTFRFVTKADGPAG